MLIAVSTVLVIVSGFLTTSAVYSNYKYLYGNVLGRYYQMYTEEYQAIQKIININTTVVQKSNINKIVLYYSHDNTNIYKIYYSTRYGQCFVQHYIIGSLYILHLATPTRVSHQLIITSDIHERYHLYSHTYQKITPDNCLKTKWTLYTMNHQSERLCLKPPICGGKESDWSPVSIATVNIWNINSTFNEMSSRRLKRLGKELTHLSIDLIALQEVRTVANKVDTISQIKILQNYLPNYQYVFQPAMLLAPWPREEEGVALLSRYPIVYTNPILLPWNQSDLSDFHQRICLHCKVDIPKTGALDVFVLHLSLSEDAQLKSAKLVINYMKKNNINGPAVILGDMNSEVNSLPIRYLVNDIGLVDVWRAYNGNSNGNTFCTLDEQLTKRIDYIFIQPSNGVCINSTYLIGKKYKIPLSDHLGVAAELLLEPR